MSLFDRNQVTGEFESILRSKIGRYYDWDKPSVEKTIGPFDPTAFDQFERKRDTIIEACFSVLKDASFDELKAIRETSIRDETGVRDAWRKTFSDDIRNLSKIKPHWAGGGFGHPNYVADFDYWGRMPRFTQIEAVAISIGVEPKHLEIIATEDEALLTNIAPALGFAKRRAEQFRRQFYLWKSESTVDAKELLSWIISVDFDVHPKSFEVLQRFHGERSPTQNSRKRPDKRELDTVASLFTAMAFEQFGYDPNAKRSTTVKDIQELAASLGISMSDDMIRHYLRHGSNFISEDWEPHSR